MTLGPADEEDAAFSSFSADDLEKWECKERVRLEDGPCLGGEGSSSVEEDPPGSVIPGVRESRCRDRCRGIENEDSSTKGLMLGSEEARGAGVCPLPSEPSNRTDLRLPTIIGMGLCASKLCSWQPPAPPKRKNQQLSTRHVDGLQVQISGRGQGEKDDDVDDDFEGLHNF